jgi:hypothetical protein
LNDLWQWNPISHQWALVPYQQSALAPSNRSNVGMAAMNKSLLIFGGQGDTGRKRATPSRLSAFDALDSAVCLCCLRFAIALSAPSASADGHLSAAFQERTRICGLGVCSKIHGPC